MTGEPASSTVGGIALWKVAAAVGAAGVISGFITWLLMLPKTVPKSVAMQIFARIVAAVCGSFTVGLTLAFMARKKIPWLYDGAEMLFTDLGLPGEMGRMAMTLVICFVGGPPGWYLIAAGVRWLDKRKGKDIVELAKELKADAKELLP